MIISLNIDIIENPEIISQCIHGFKHQVTHLDYIQFLFVDYASVIYKKNVCHYAQRN